MAGFALPDMSDSCHQNELFDVIVIHIEDGNVDSIVGARLTLNSGHMNANSRLQLIKGRLNDQFDAVIVPHGKYKKNDKYQED